MVYQSSPVEPGEPRESYPHYLGRLVRTAGQGTVQLAKRAIILSSNGLESFMSPSATMINNNIDHDKRHKDLHDIYKRMTG